MLRRRPLLRLLSLLAIVAFVAVACGDDDGDDTAESSESSSTEAPQGEEEEDEASGEPQELTVAVASSGIPFLQIDAAEAQGFYEDQNLTVDFLEVEGSAAATAAVESGQADVMITLPEGVITARAAGSTLKMIGATVNENLYRLYVAEGITELEDLVGKSVAMLVEGNGTDIQARWLLDNHGAGADQSTFVATGGLANRLAALQAGQAQATFLFPPFDAEASKAGLEAIVEMSEYVEGYPNEVIATRQETIDEKPEALRAFMAAIVDAANWLVDNPDEAIALAVEVTGSAEDVVTEAYEFTKPAYAVDGAIANEGLQWTLDVMSEYMAVENLPAVEDVYDDSFLP